MTNYNPKVMKKYCADIFEKAGLRRGDAEIFADGLITADLRGISSHGISRTKVYSERIEMGAVNTAAEPRILIDSGAVITVDGDNGAGIVTARKIMDICIERAKTQGCCFAAVRNGNHFGTGAYFTEYAASKGMLGFVVSNSEAAVVPIGGSVPMLGTNPLSVAIPAGRHAPLVLDMATSTVARGKVVYAAKTGKKIPLGWGVDAEGANTEDPQKILDGGAMLPFGGAKGYGISMIIDVLCSCVAGAFNCRETPSFWSELDKAQNIGYFMGAMDISKFTNYDEYKAKTDAYFDEFKKCPPAPGFDEVKIPGEIEHENYMKGLENGITVPETVQKELYNLGVKFGLKMPEKML